MSIATKTGDTGTTGLLFGKRVPKTDLRIETNGQVDELNAALGLARAALRGTVGEGFITDKIFAIQKELVTLMGEIAVAPEDRERHTTAGYGQITQERVDVLTGYVDDLEKNHKISFKKWATPGDSLGSAALDVARTVCRRAERAVVELADLDPSLNEQIVRYLNRLSDLCWLWARWVETVENKAENEPA
jgi:cob(I)alamin adenosyltransferase